MDNQDPLDLAAIGNGRVAALCDDRGRICWFCFPRLDADPVFSRLLAGNEEKGFADVVVDGAVHLAAEYRRNTAILETRINDAHGNGVLITDFCPRYRRFERYYHPPILIRRIEPAFGEPRVTIRVRPTFDHGRPPTSASIGSNHIRFGGHATCLRLTTDAPLTYIMQETAFVVSRPVTLIFGPDEPIEGAVEQTGLEMLQRTAEYWVDWVRSLSIPLEWQQAVIRAAVALKICSFDETGAIVAALTTSIPEAPGSQRNWDYRYCWPRDAHFVVKALNQLGATQTMEAYLGYVANLSRDSESLRPVYGIIYNQPLREWVTDHLKGYCSDGPVRIGNAAADQPQHDTYGSIILAASHMFIDERLPAPGGIVLFRALERLGEQALIHARVPDAGPWELRGRRRLHSYSIAICWVACDRLAAIAGRLGLSDRQRSWTEAARDLRAMLLDRSWNDQRRSFVAALDSDDLDASSLLFAELGVVAADDVRYVSTVNAIERELSRGGFIMRYTTADDFGEPNMAFLACQFWYIDALQRIGRGQEARSLFEAILSRRNRFGLLSEDIDTVTGRLWGNIPQTYSMAGLINSATLLSRRWDDAWAMRGT